ncbi:MAG: alpha/beta fold hydrolase [Treponema sp.]|nr:alpha/beta fold hydrolase [Treponema sp.]
MKKIALFLSVALSLSSCGTFLLHDSFRGGDWFYLENKSAVMPVWVTGNIEPKVFIIWIHGGPGGTSIVGSAMDVFEELQKDYAFVWWDQRGSGQSQGNARPDSLSLEQFVADLEMLVALIRHKYDDPTLFLMGHSWGGTLSAAFLSKPENQAGISGWISIAGAHSPLDAKPLSVEWVVQRAAGQIASGLDAAYWSGELVWYGGNPSLVDVSDALRHSGNVRKLNGFIHEPSNAPALSFPLLLFASSHSLATILNANSVERHLWPRIAGLDLHPRMRGIKTPSLILGGRHDGIVPFQIAEMGHGSLGADPAHKFLHIFEDSAHSPPWEEPELFSRLVSEFVERHRANAQE